MERHHRKKIDKKKIIVFVTERRADYSRLKPIMQAVQASSKLQMRLVVTGMHLLDGFGRTQNVIEQDGFKVDAVLPTFRKNDPDNGASMARAFGRAVIGLTDIFEKLKPDLVFAGFDIGANFAAAVAGMHMNTYVSHIQGGEVTGTIDEVLRHALTKFSHIHFAATDQSAKRIIKLGERPAYVFNVGSPSIDTIKKLEYQSRDAVFQKFDLDPEKSLILLLQHPVTTEVGHVGNQISETISAIREISKKYPVQTLAIYSNNDAGGKRIVTDLKRSGITVLPHVVYEDFLHLMKYAGVLVGNSSAGIHEAPSFGLPTVNIGTRQQMRERGRNVIDVHHESKAIVQAITKSLFDVRFIRHVRAGKNPYGNGDTAKRIVRILENLRMPPIQKIITY